VRRVHFFHQQREIQAGRTAADADDVHDCSNLDNLSLKHLGGRVISPQLSLRA
jgi:hypothetical protein